ncbi:NACHT domain-containing protein [Streptomyces aquilus]|uniref:NACHT domain-containing protein n=1 Tax=Streptomyces aquilus TaxID=2548456 RepID=UPI0014170A64|nr:NACHT domain-containing protein [Streptomyces aquilus]
MGTTHDARAALETVLSAALRTDQPRDKLSAALIGVQTFSFMRDSLSGLGTTPDTIDVEHACSRVRDALFVELPKKYGPLVEELNLTLPQSRVVLSVLGGMTITQAVRELEEMGEHHHRSWGSRLMPVAAKRLAAWVIKREEGARPAAADDRLRAYMDKLVLHCGELPSWFPPLSFTEISQEVIVTPPADSGGQSDPPGERSATAISLGKSTGTTAPRRMQLSSALDRYHFLTLVGGPGSGKSWAVRARALSLAKEQSVDGHPQRIPILIAAPKLETVLAEAKPSSGDPAALAKALAEALPSDVAQVPDAVTEVAQLLQTQSPVELLIDGYDEVREQQPLLAAKLSEIIDLLHPRHSRFVLTTRPSAVPQHRVAKQTVLCEVQPFGTAEQLRFVRAWFEGRTERSLHVRRWVTDRRIEWLRSPLLLALLCKVSEGKDDTPPRTEHELWKRALKRLTAEEDRHAGLSETDDERVRLRLHLLKDVASLFQNDSGLCTEVPIATIEDRLAGAPQWQALERLIAPRTAIDDLVATGVVQKAKWRDDYVLVFLHDAIRDHLLAQHLAEHGTWFGYVWRIWAQPEWEQVIGATGTFLAEPDVLIRELEIRFSDDPLNAARFTAGLVLAAGACVSEEKRERIRDELLVLLCSNDFIDRSRSAVLLSSMKDSRTVGLVRNLLHPSLPTHVITAALRAIAGGTAHESLEALIDCARRDDFTPEERESAVDALAETTTKAALDALESLAADERAHPVVRAAAALHALRSFDTSAAVRKLLVTSDVSARLSQRELAERVLRHADTALSLAEEIATGTLEPSDPYCAALILSVDPAAAEHGEKHLVRGLPGNMVVDVTADAVERLRSAALQDPLLVVLARYILEPGAPTELRWLMACTVKSADTPTLIGIWDAFADELSKKRLVDVGQFLLEEADRLPPEIREKLCSAIDGGVFGPLVQALRVPGRDPLPEPRQAAALDTGGEVGALQSAQSVSEAEPVALPTIEQILNSTQPMTRRYQLLRAVRRAIPAQGPERRDSAVLTAVMAVGSVTDWIDVQPRVAPLAEARLVVTPHANADVELARLRAKWPDRQEEVEHTPAPFSAQVLDARAEAALMSNDLDEAATMALASIGARQADMLAPTMDSVSALFAAGATSGRTWSTHRQVHAYLSRLPRGYRQEILKAWLAAANSDFSTVAGVLEKLPAFTRSLPDVAGLRLAAGVSGEEALKHVVSWAGCMRVAVLLQAVRAFDVSPIVAARLDAARAALTRQAHALCTSWPPVKLDAPSNQGTPRWSWTLVEIATTQLKRGRADIAVAIYESVVDKSPDNARFLNNLGFCQIPLDRDLALRTLDKAAGLFAVPFAVNVANRMLLHLLNGNAKTALEIGDDYYRRGSPATPGSWLWNMDASSVLEEDVDEQAYIMELGRRAAVSLGEYDLAEVWEQRLRSRRAGAGGAGDDG